MEKYLYKDLDNLESSHFWHVSKRKTALKLLSQYKSGGKPKILDIGCGTGGNLQALAKLGEAFGIDNAKEAVAFCKKKGLEKVKLGMSDKTGFRSGSFDIVVVFDVLEHVDDAKTLKEINRILKKGGVVLITVPAYNWLWSRWDEVLHHRRRYGKNGLNNALKKEGFVILKSSYMYSYLLLPIIVTRAIKNIFFKNYYPSDFKLSSPWVNKAGLAVAYFERLFISSIGVPFGTSIISLAKKP